jgi:hypothetical protein
MVVEDYLLRRTLVPWNAFELSTSAASWLSQLSGETHENSWRGSNGKLQRGRHQAFRPHVANADAAVQILHDHTSCASPSLAC